MTGIKQLAQHLGISIGTVSRALNNKPDVNKETRARVFAEAARLGYAPNQSGRSLRQGVTNTVGLVIESGPMRALEGDSFFPNVISRLHKALGAHQLDLILLPSREDESGPECLQRIVARGLVDALIISETRREDPRISFLLESKLPFVSFGRSLTGSGYAWVDVDFAEGARRSVARMIEKGHRRIATCIPDNEANYRYLFLDGYRQALTEAGIAIDESLIFLPPPGPDVGVIAAKKMLAMADRPTAILLKNDLSAFGLYSTLIDGGLQPGEDVAIISFGDSPQARFLKPGLTTCYASLDVVADSLAQALVRVMQRKRSAASGEPTHAILPMFIDGRQSDAFELS